MRPAHLVQRVTSTSKVRRATRRAVAALCPALDNRPPLSSDRGISATSCSDRRPRAAVFRAIPDYVGLLSGVSQSLTEIEVELCSEDGPDDFLTTVEEELAAATRPKHLLQVPQGHMVAGQRREERKRPDHLRI